MMIVFTVVIIFHCCQVKDCEPAKIVMKELLPAMRIILRYGFLDSKIMQNLKGLDK